MRRALPAIVTGGLGLNLWVVLVGLPAIHVGVGVGIWVACALPLAPLGVGAAATSRPELVAGASRLAAPLLLLAFPLSSLFPLALERALTGVNVYGPGNLLVATLALLAFGVGTLLVLARTGRASVERRTVPIQGWVLPPDARRRRAGRLSMIVGAALVGASTVTAAFLRPGAARDVLSAYGDASTGATVGIGALALVLPLGVLLVYFGPPMRHPAREDPVPPPWSRLRSTLALVLVGAAAAVALVLLRAGRW